MKLVVKIPVQKGLLLILPVKTCWFQKNNGL
jgi:hypothetical protein